MQNGLISRESVKGIFKTGKTITGRRLSPKTIIKPVGLFLGQSQYTGYVF